MAMPFYPEIPVPITRYPVIGRPSGVMPVPQRIPVPVVQTVQIPVAPVPVPFPAPISPPRLAAPLPVPVTAPIPFCQPAPAPQLAFSPVKEFGNQSAADALDAADGVIDGKYFGMRILAPTKGDPYSSPAKAFDGTTGGSYTAGAPAPIPSGGPLGPAPSSPYLASAMSPTLLSGASAMSPTLLSGESLNFSGGFASPSPLPVSAYPGASPLPTSSDSVLNASYSSGTIPVLSTPYSPLPSSVGGIGGFSSGLDTFGLPTAGFLTAPPSSLPITSGALSGMYGSSFTGVLGDSILSTGTALQSSYLGGSLDRSSYLSTGQIFGTPLSSASLTTGLPPATLSSSPGPISGLSTSLLGTPLGGGMAFLGNTSSPPYPAPSGDIPGSPLAPKVPEGGPSTINISNTGWEKAVDELKKEVDALKVDGGMSALRELLQMKVDELERCRQSELVKEKELHRLQDMYAEEIRKHTEDLAKVRKAESDLAVLRQAEEERRRLVQVEQEKAAADALAQMEAMKLAQASKPKKVKKGKKKAAKKSPSKAPRR